MAAAEEQFLSLENVAARLQVSDQTVRRWIKSGKLTAYKPGLEYRIRETDLEEFLRAREVRPKAPRRSPYEPTLLNGLEEEQRSTINYRACRTALDGFCDYWHEVLDAGQVDLQALEDFNAAAACLSPTYLELWSKEKTELGPQEDAGEPVFHSERSTLWPAIDRYIALGIQMDRIARERFDRHGTAEVIDIFTKKAS